MTLHPLIKKFLPIALGLALAGVFAIDIAPQIGRVNTVQAEVSPVIRTMVSQAGNDADKLRELISGCPEEPFSANQECTKYIQDAISKIQPGTATNSGTSSLTPGKADAGPKCFSGWADAFNPFNWVTCGALVISWIVNSILGLFVAMAAWLAQLTLGLSAHVFDLPVVQRGFSVFLALANLGFVLGIIVIAIATILRIENYGMKQILWKLVVMAILVNFSFAIAGTIVHTADSLADYLIDKTAPSTGLGSAVAGTTGSTPYFAFVDRITNGLSPQSYFQPPETSAGNGGVGLQKLFIQLFSLIFSAVFLVLITLCFLTMAILFLMRFVFIGLLLILMPLAWLSWVFPLMKSNWDKWWGYFLKWTFFAPLCILFLYLAMLSAQKGDPKTDAFIAANLKGGTSIANQTNNQDVGAALANITGKNAGILGTAAQGVMMLALAFGGLFMANSLSITGAATAMGAVKAGGKAAGGWARKRVGGGMARFATQIPAAAPPPPGGGLRGGIARLQHTISTSAPVSGVRNAVQKVTTSNAAVEMGVTEKLLKYGSSTTPAHEEVKAKRREGWQKLQKAKSQAPIAELEKEAEGWESKIHGVEKLRDLEAQAEAKEKAKDGVLLDSDKAKLQQEADALRNEAKLLATTSKELADAYATKKYTEAITDLTHEMGKVIDTARTEAGKLPNAAELLTLIDKKEVRKQQDALMKESEEAWTSANKMAKANPTLAGAVYAAVEKAVTGHGKVSDHSKHEIAEALGIQMAHGDDHGGGDHGGGHGGDHGGGAHGAGGGGHEHATPAAHP